LAAYAIEKNVDLIVVDNLSRTGSRQNLAWLFGKGEFNFIEADTRNSDKLCQIIRDEKPDAIFHLAGQVAMTTSIADPRSDFDINAGGTLNVLEAVRIHSPNTAVLYSSTNKVYGDLEQYTYQETETRYVCREFPKGFGEDVNLCFHSPYGCSKGAADQYVLDYARIFGLRTVVFRHSSMYGGRQFATEDQGWIGWFCQKALEIKRSGGTGRVNISGNGKQVRDLLHAEDMISLYFSALNKIDEISGEAFNVGGGYENSLSLLELISHLEETVGCSMEIVHGPIRRSDQRVFIASLNKINEKTGWSPQVDYSFGIKMMLEWVDKIDNQS